MATIRGKKSSVVAGTSANDVITSGGGSGTISGGGGNDTYNFVSVGDNSSVTGGAGSDTFVIKTHRLGNDFYIDGGTSSVSAASSNLAFNGVTTPTSNYTGGLGSGNTDSTLVIKGRPGSAGSIDTNATTLGTPNATDAIRFTKSGDFTNIKGFVRIEQIRLDAGASVTLTMDQYLTNLQSLDNGVTNPGIHVYGPDAGKTATLTVVGEYADSAFIPASTVPAGIQHYSIANFQLDDASTANILHGNVRFVYDMKSESGDDSYGRVDGTNANDVVYGSNGVDNMTLRLGNDTAFGGSGDDVIMGHGGADSLSGGSGNDTFVIGGFGTGVSGTTSKADDGRPEWIISTAEGSRAGVTNGVTDSSYGNNFDVIDGGSGRDVLRITTGIGATSKTKGTVVLSDANFKNMEVVQVGGLLSRANTEDSNTQILNGHYYFNATGTVSDSTDTTKGHLTGSSINNVVVDASGVTKNGLTFEGNANTQTFIGTTQADRFIGNGGADTLTGGAGADTFVFGKVLSYAVVGTSTDAQGYGLKATAFTSADADLITDFVRGTDKIELHVDQFDKLGTYAQDDDGIYVIDAASKATAANFVSGLGATATSATTYLIYDTTTGVLSYDADGNGSGAAVTIAVLGTSTHPALAFGDFVIV